MKDELNETRNMFAAGVNNGAQVAATPMYRVGVGSIVEPIEPDEQPSELSDEKRKRLYRNLSELEKRLAPHRRLLTDAEKRQLFSATGPEPASK